MIQSVLKNARSRIDAVDARILLRHALSVSNEYLAANLHRSLSTEEIEKFQQLVNRRANGEPVAYITGKREFFALEFEVSPAVLIPRPETELLVELVLEKASKDNKISVLDLGTGSGAIAISISYHRPLAKILAVELSQAAVDLARRNAVSILPEPQQRQLTVSQGNWYSPVFHQNFDMIVSNPPYIAGDDSHLFQDDLRFEPSSALTPGSNGLSALQEIISNAPSHLNSDGWLLCEHGYDQGEAVKAMFHAAGFNSIFSAKDLAGIDRVTGGCWTNSGKSHLTIASSTPYL